MNVEQVVKFLKEKNEDGVLLREKCLIWCMMGVAVEKEIDGRLIESDWVLGKELVQVFWKGEERMERMRKLKWGLDEAEKLLKKYKKVHEMLAEAMLNGLSAGECVFLLSESFR